MYVTVDFCIKYENAEMKLKKQEIPMVFKCLQDLEKYHTWETTCMWLESLKLQLIATISGYGASPVSIFLGELVISIFGSFHFDTPALN